MRRQVKSKGRRGRKKEKEGMREHTRMKEKGERSERRRVGEKGKVSGGGAVRRLS